jgi:hypothetical protein
VTACPRCQLPVRFEDGYLTEPFTPSAS